MKRGKGVGAGTGPEGKRGGKNEGKRVGGNGPESALDFELDARTSCFLQEFTL